MRCKVIFIIIMAFILNYSIEVHASMTYSLDEIENNTVTSQSKNIENNTYINIFTLH